MRDLLVHNVQREIAAHDPVHVVHAEQVVQDDPEVVGRVALLVRLRLELRRHVIVFHDRWLSVLEAHRANLLVRGDFAHDFRARRFALREDRAEEDGIADALQDVVDREDVEPLGTVLFQLRAETGTDQRQEPAAVAVRGGRDPACGLHVDLAFVV